MEDTSGMDGIKICKETGELYYDYNTLTLALNLLYFQAQQEEYEEEDIPWEQITQLLSEEKDPPRA